MKLAEIRNLFLNFFKAKGHSVVESSSLVPVNDPSLLFTNAGMVQFKDVFLGKDKRSYTTATSSQKCVRAGGKHNDLENVGFTARHHTFFEMLGNFSFGDYFKKEAIAYAWEFITVNLKIPKEKLWITVYKDDKESEEIWLKEIGIAPNRFSRCGDKDNFWSMGDTGPCGPCTEIFYDHGEEIAGGPPGSIDEDGDRFIEIWNLVFMQYNRDSSGKLEKLPKPSVDTGMGLERVAAIMQQKHNNYDIDLFFNIINNIAKEFNIKDLSNTSLKVIADHLRSCAFLVLDGVLPSNEGRGYVLRRIMRRAIRHGHKLGVKQNFFYKCVKFLINEMGEAYPDLNKNSEKIEEIFLNEENQFSKTIDNGLNILTDELEKLIKNNTNILSGGIAFMLYDTYGFPLDLTEDIAREKNIKVDTEVFHENMQKQKEMAKKASQFSIKKDDLNLEHKTNFTGYISCLEKSVVIDLLKDGKSVNSLDKFDEGIIVLDKTPFYAESGGQVGDIGLLENDLGTIKVEVLDTQKNNNSSLHFVKVLSGKIELNSKINAKIDIENRNNIKLNHTATHLLHAALRNLLGEQVQQKGSIVEADKLRFDFSYGTILLEQQIEELENKINDQIRKNYKVETKEMALAEAKQIGAMALFGEKYSDKVRVLSIGDVSIELCGGTHVNQTGDIGLFKIINQSAVAAGVRRIEAVTGAIAFNIVNNKSKQLDKVSKLLKCAESDVIDKIEKLIENQKKLEKDYKNIQEKLVLKSNNTDELLKNIKNIKNIQVLSKCTDIKDIKLLRSLIDNLTNKLKNNFILVLAIKEKNKANVIVKVSNDLLNNIHAGELVNFVANQIGGKGGGRKDMAQAGGSQPENLEKALNSVSSWLNERL